MGTVEDEQQRHVGVLVTAEDRSDVVCHARSERALGCLSGRQSSEPRMQRGDPYRGIRHAAVDRDRDERHAGQPSPREMKTERAEQSARA
ncbi:hypothetical protein [Sorangium sp. So ce128]|uniref:hypothetical protein n=1 Tax=Sorangium sp. So ce128 TaxID=3133281 RepID=UPI003F630E5F